MKNILVFFYLEMKDLDPLILTFIRKRNQNTLLIKYLIHIDHQFLMISIADVYEEDYIL